MAPPDAVGRPVPRWADRNQHVHSLIEAALLAVDPAEAVARHLSLDGDLLQVGPHTVRLSGKGRVFVVGAGKAGAAMAAACQSILGKRLSTGIMAVPDPPAGSSGPIHWIAGGHPIPNEGSLQAGRAILALLGKASKHDVVLALISGGASALLELPVEGIDLQDLQLTTDLLLRSGADIRQVNCVRHQLSRIKGGGLARAATPAPVYALVLSDVVGDRLDIIASGPTVIPETQPEQAMDILERLDLVDAVPDSVRTRLQVAVHEMPRDVAPSRNVIIGTNRLAGLAARDRASEIGFLSMLLTARLEGEARSIGTLLAALAKSIREEGDPIAPPACLIAGGESTVTVRGPGIGGRNLETALAASLALEGWSRCLVVTLATDGVDGPTPAAGAIVDGRTADAGRNIGLDPHQHLRDNDSYPFLAKVGAAIEPGPTGTNVNDLAFVLVYE